MQESGRVSSSLADITIGTSVCEAEVAGTRQGQCKHKWKAVTLTYVFFAILHAKLVSKFTYSRYKHLIAWLTNTINSVIHKYATYIFMHFIWGHTVVV